MSDDEFCMYLIARKDLAMSPGKLAAQVGHAVQLAIREAEYSDGQAALDAWESTSHTKIVLGVADLNELRLVRSAATRAGIPWVEVWDEGRTELSGKTLTVLGLVPVKKSWARPVVGGLGVYR